MGNIVALTRNGNQSETEKKDTNSTEGDDNGYNMNESFDNCSDEKKDNKTNECLFNIRLMTFNVWWGAYGNKISYNNLDWSKRKYLMEQMINDTNPTIIGFQEIMEIHLSNLPQTKHKLIRGECREKGWNEFNSILYDPSIITLKQTETFWLSHIPYTKYSKLKECEHPRIALWALFDINHNNKYEILFINTHLSSNSKDNINKQNEIREEQIHCISNQINELKNNRKDIQFDNRKELLIFLCGDFNTPKNSESYDRMVNILCRNNNICDCIIKYAPNNPDFTWHDWKGLDFKKSAEYKTKWNYWNAPIDLIFCSKNVTENEEINISDGHIYTKSKTLSDHYPVYVNMTFK